MAILGIESSPIHLPRRLILLMARRPVGDALRRKKKIPTKNKRRREAKTRRVRLPSPEEVLKDILRFLIRRCGTPIYRVKVSFNRGFLPHIPRECRESALQWYGQMTSGPSARFGETEDGLLCDKSLLKSAA
jgi:hypothetical protein